MADLNQFADEIFYERDAMRPKPLTWLKHLGFLLATLITATIAGVLYPFGMIETLPESDPQSWPEIFQFIISLPSRYIALVSDAVYRLATDINYLTYGLSFSLSLLFILICHEMGHYIACRLYKVDATLPFFVPTPPMLGPAGTFGAFIKITSPMPSRKAVFDIGVAGPIAGFIALIPVAVTGFLTMKTLAAPPFLPPGTIVFAEPLFFQILAPLLGVDLALGIANPFYYAAWVGLLVTALNLIPSGQLDGGHAIYAVFGAKVHRWTGRIAFAVMSILSVLGWIYFNSPSGFLIAVLLGVMLRVGHPHPYDQSPLDTKRKAIAVLTLVIFLLCFVPFPIQIK